MNIRSIEEYPHIAVTQGMLPLNSMGEIGIGKSAGFPCGDCGPGYCRKEMDLLTSLAHLSKNVPYRYHRLNDKDSIRTVNYDHRPA